MKRRLIRSKYDKYLLDFNPNASLAHSLGYLSSEFLGNEVILVRRESNDDEDAFTPIQIINGSLASFVGSGDGFVKCWYDQSGEGNDSTQATNINQPKIVSSGTVLTVNGLPAIKFDGTSSSFDSLISFSDIANASIFTVFKSEDSSQDGNLYIHTSNNDIIGLNLGKTGSNTIGAAVVYDANEAIRAGGVIGLEQSLASLFAINKTSVELYINSVQLLVSDSFGRGNYFLNQIGSYNAFLFNGYMQEHIVFESNESDNKTGIEDNIKSRYSIS